MNCKTAEKLIFEYVFEDIEAEDRKYLLDHLNSCLKCRDTYYEFKELLNGSGFNAGETEPRYEIVDRLQQIARINSQKDESPIRKYLRMPFLAPVLGAAMAFMIFLNFGNELDLSFVDSSIQQNPDNLLIAKNSEEKENETRADEKTGNVTKKNYYAAEVDRSLVVRTQYTQGFGRGVSISDIDDEFFNDSRVKSSPASSGNVHSAEKSTANTGAEPAAVSDKNENVISKSGIASSKELKADIAGENLSFNVVKDNAAGFEVASSVSNPEKVLSLNSEPSPQSGSSRVSAKRGPAGCDILITDDNSIDNGNYSDIDQKKKLYNNIAECYEHEGNWQKAIDNYNTLIEFDSNRSSYYQEKIRFIRDNHIGN